MDRAPSSRTDMRAADWTVAIDCAVVLKKFRAIKRVTQAEAAKWYGVSERSWRRWEASGRVPLPVMKRVREYARRHPHGKLIHDSF